MVTITESEFKELAGFIHNNYGIFLKEEKQSLVMGRLHNELSEKSFTSFSDYYDYVINDKSGEAVKKLVEKITTNHTYFMREKEHFRIFNDVVLPYLSQNNQDDDLRIWSAGCSSGEEPYTLAMIINSFCNNKKMWNDTKILATDISNKVLKKAKKGIYTNENIAGLPPLWKMNYFTRIDQHYSKINDNIMDEVLFKNFNLMTQTFPFRKKFQVIFCRNVMIYFNETTRQELIKKFYDCTQPGGYLFIGQSESINRSNSEYKYIMPSVYRKI
jgi:chemotaxis protein methyltransferase CheR